MPATRWLQKRSCPEIHNQNQMSMIKANQAWYNNALTNGICVDSMIRGEAKRTTQFNVDTGRLGITVIKCSRGFIF